MKKESILNKNNQSQKEANSTDKNTHNNSKDEFKKKITMIKMKFLMI